MPPPIRPVPSHFMLPTGTPHDAQRSGAGVGAELSALARVLTPRTQCRRGKTGEDVAASIVPQVGSKSSQKHTRKANPRFISDFIRFDMILF